MSERGYSVKCNNLQTYWDKRQQKCVECDMEYIKPGMEFTPNCGYVDDGGRRASQARPCKDGFYNDGRYGVCQRCSSCPGGLGLLHVCNNTTDTQCCPTAKDCGKENIHDLMTHAGSSDLITEVPQPGRPSDALWIAPIVVLGFIVVGVLSYFIYKRRRRLFEGPKVQSAPLRAVLDDLDVLDELIILLDPEGSGVKCTRHLASSCSFPSTWINYTYSMRDSKSPLIAVLEGVTTKSPDWTVGHLAQLLAEMGRSDAVVVLAKLKLKTEAV